jgi:hypothetical protein
VGGLRDCPRGLRGGDVVGPAAEGDVCVDVDVGVEGVDAFRRGQIEPFGVVARE